MFRIEMLPAREGDCLIVSYGEEGSLRRILIDGGRKATYQDFKNYFSLLPEAERVFELLIVTHVDRDHIEGILALFDDPELPIVFKDIWFNSYQHLNDEFEEFSAVQGERLTEYLTDGVAQERFQWNGHFGEHYEEPVALSKNGDLLEITLEGDMVLTLLSPSRQKLHELISKWDAQCRKAGIVAGIDYLEPAQDEFENFAAIDIDALAEQPFEPDPSEPNGSSIAVIATYNEKSAVLTGDAHVDCLLKSIAQLNYQGDKPKFDVFKLPHHGSRKNVSEELLNSFVCSNYLISTNGSYFNHPDPVAMSRLVKYGGLNTTIWFNYLSEETESWQVSSWMEDFDYDLKFPNVDRNGFQTISLE
jgi:beta-lactamase superfamily II metal-dependent hydrolase